MRYINDGAPWPDAVVQKFVDRQVEFYAARRYCRWKLLLKDTEEMVGFCGAGMLEGLPDPEIGWWLAERHWGRGLATEAARAALHDLFTRVKLDRVISVAIPENARSLQIMRKVGLHYQSEGVRKGFPVVIYGIGREEYLATRRSPADGI